MAAHIRRLAPADVDAVVALSLRAWAPVFESFSRVLGPSIYQRLYPDWLISQAKAVETVCRDEKVDVWIAEAGGVVCGFAAVVLHDGTKAGEIEMLAVDPSHQREGVGTALTTTALEHMSNAGCELAVVATGGDPGHLPARLTYEKAGFTALPLVRYYKAL